MFEDQDLQKEKDQVSSNQGSNTLNNKLVQSDKEESTVNKERKTSYQEKLKNSQIAEDMFNDTDKDSNDSKKVLKAQDLGGKNRLSPVKPLTNYQELVEESNNISSDKIKPRYFVIGLIIFLILLFSLGFWAYKVFFTGERDSGEIILNTRPESIQLEKKELEEEVVEPGINVNSSSVSNDIDGDGLSNEEESILGTDPEKSDTDEDGLSDREEVKIYHTDPLHQDSDLDSYLDGEEIESGYNPLGPGKLFDFSLITGEEKDENWTESTIKELIKPNIDISDWSSFKSNTWNLAFRYPFEWGISEEENKIIISPNDIENEDYVEIEIRENILELDLVDWVSTQDDYPDLKQDQLKINDNISLVVYSDDPNWEPLSSIFVSQKDLVYNFKFFSEDSASDNFNIFQTMVLSTSF